MTRPNQPEPQKDIVERAWDALDRRDRTLDAEDHQRAARFWERWDALEAEGAIPTFAKQTVEEPVEAHPPPLWTTLIQDALSRYIWRPTTAFAAMAVLVVWGLQAQPVHIPMTPQKLATQQTPAPTTPRPTTSIAQAPITKETMYKHLQMFQHMEMLEQMDMLQQSPALRTRKGS